jgi:hypothetical protein
VGIGGVLLRLGLARADAGNGHKSDSSERRGSFPGRS